MTDYGHAPLFGAFITPSADRAHEVMDLTMLADRVGLDLVMYQDHPYQPAFLDTQTLLAMAAARTERIHLAANVTNLPLRDPLILAKSAATIDILSDGRFELGLGAGAFWDAIEAVGGRRLTPGQSVDALREAIGLIREVWDTQTRGGIRRAGRYYSAAGAKRGPSPVHDMSIWVGAYKPRMLALTGALADGWLPSIDYLPKGIDSYPELNARIDEAAAEAERSPAEVRRFAGFGRTSFDGDGADLLAGPPATWVEQLTELALTHGVSGFTIASDDSATVERFAAEVVPATREAIALERRTAAG